MTKLRRGIVGLVAAGALCLLAPGTAPAQKKGKPAAAKAARDTAPAAAPARGDALPPGQKEPEARVERTERGGKVIKLTPIVVEGKVQKPLALVLARSQVQYDWEQLKQDFMPKIVEAVSKSPF